MAKNSTYHQTSDISGTLVGSKMADHSDVVAGAAPTTSSFSTSTSGFNGLGKDNHKTGRETLKRWNLVRLILEIWQYIDIMNMNLLIIDMDFFIAIGNTSNKEGHWSGCCFGPLLRNTL